MEIIFVGSFVGPAQVLRNHTNIHLLKQVRKDLSTVLPKYFYLGKSLRRQQVLYHQPKSRSEFSHVESDEFVLPLRTILETIVDILLSNR